MRDLIRFRNWIARLTENVYVRLMSKRRFERINNRILNLALHARGYQNHGTQEKTGEKYFLSSMKKWDIQLALDVGANVGQYSRVLIDELDCNVVAFEPIETAFRQLAFVKREFPDRFESLQIALSDADGLQEIYFSKNLGELASLDESNMNLDFFKNQNTEKTEVKIAKLDSVVHTFPSLFPRIDFIKIDVEGHEYSVIKGALETIRKFQPKLIQTEFNIYNLFSEISLLKITSLLPDYRLFQILPNKGGLAERNPNDALTNLCIYSNFVFVHKNLEMIAKS